MIRRAPGFRMVALAAPVTAIALMVACAPKPREPDPIVFWQFWPVEAIDPLLRRFEAENPGLRVRMERLAWDSGRDSITAAMATGRVPDLCQMGSTLIPPFLESGALSDWSAGVADQRDSLRGWELCTVGDAIYGMPWVLGTRALFYNKALFARAHLDPERAPGTWEELRRAAVAIQRLGRGVHGYGVSANDRGKLFTEFMPYAWGNGGEILSDGRDSARFDSPANRVALEFYLSLRAAGLIGMPGALDREFEQGRLGLHVSGAWLFQQIAREAPGLRYGVALIPCPSPGRGAHASFAEGEVLVSFNASRRKAEALRLARFLARPDNALALARALLSVQPAARGADTLRFYREHPEQQVMALQLETARFTPRHPEWDAMEAAIEDEIEQALYDKKTAAQAVSDANARIAELAGK